MPFKKLDFVTSRHPLVYFGIVLVGPIEIPYFDDCVASQASTVPVDLDDEKTWQRTFTGYIVLELGGDFNYHIVNENSLTKIEPSNEAGYVPFDHGTGQLKLPLSLIKLANKWYGHADSLKVNIKL